MRLPPLFDQVRELALRDGDWVIAGSAPMLVHGLIDTINDIDIVARGAAWARACELGDPQPGEHGDRRVRLAGGAIEVFDGWSLMPWSVDRLIGEAQWLEGLPFIPLQRVLEFKRCLARPKDAAHIRLIEARLSAGDAP
jgi:hypothetical protein